MKRLSFLCLALACLLGFVGSASSQTTNFTVSPSSPHALAQGTVNETTEVDVALTNISGAPLNVENVTAPRDAIEIDGVDATGPLTSTVDISITPPVGSAVQMTQATDDADLKATFPGSGVAFAIGQTRTFRLAIKLKRPGANDVSLNFNQDVLGYSGFYQFTRTMVNPPAAATPPQKVKIKPFVSMILDVPSVRTDSTGIPAHANWGGDDPVFSPDITKFVWLADGVQVATGKDPWLWMSTGRTAVITVVGENADGSIKPTSAPQTVFFGPPIVSESRPFNPGDSGYHPVEEPPSVNQGSDLRKTTEKVGAVDNKRVWPKSKAAGKPVAVESVTWGWVKNREQ